MNLAANLFLMSLAVAALILAKPNPGAPRSLRNYWRAAVLLWIAAGAIVLFSLR